MLSIKCLVLSLCFNVLLAAEFINPCPDILSFRQKGCGFEAIMKIPNDYSGEYTFIVNASWVGIGSDVKDLDINIENYKDANEIVLSHIIYVVTYPVCKYFPKFTRATFNGRVVCSGPGHKATTLQGVTNLSIISKMTSSKQKEGNSIIESRLPVITTPSSFAYNPVFARLTTAQPTAAIITQPVVNKPFIQPNAATCGVVNEIEDFIIKGIRVKEGEFPWMVALFYFKTKENVYEFICTSNLISNRHIITAAHCAVLEKEDFIVVLGKASLVNWALGAKTAQVNKIYKHPNYEEGKSENDLAIFALTKEVPISNKIRPICLWRWGHSTDWLIKNGGTTAGWGRADDDYKYSYQLNKININVVSQTNCKDRTTLLNAVSEKTFCGLANRKDAGPCSGDSGGGFFIESENKFYLRGIVSAGHTSCNVNEFTIFVDLYMNREWINGIISD